jgi:hypothetical protein
MELILPSYCPRWFNKTAAVSQKLCWFEIKDSVDFTSNTKKQKWYQLIVLNI